jgi:hypothetical protein
VEYSGTTPEKDYHALKREELKDHFREFQISLEWLKKNALPSGKCGAHYYREQVQFACKPAHPGYFHIPRGVFILAALQKGYWVRKMKGSSDAWIK